MEMVFGWTLLMVPVMYWEGKMGIFYGMEYFLQAIQVFEMQTPETFHNKYDNCLQGQDTKENEKVVLECEVGVHCKRWWFTIITTE